MSFKFMKGLNSIGVASRMVYDRLKCDVLTIATGKAQCIARAGEVKPRMAAFKDLSHAYVDIYVEIWRASAYLMGHLLAIAVPFLIVVSILEVV